MKNNYLNHPEYQTLYSCPSYLDLSNICLTLYKLNMEFSNPEQIKKFKILPRDFTIDDGELTPTLKIRRKQINENWSKAIQALYVSENANDG